MVKVIIDYRERKIFESIKQTNCEIEIKNLMIGDIIILKENRFSKINSSSGDFYGSAIVIERKSIFDFISSLRSKRIWDQLFKLMDINHIFGYKIKHRLLVIQQTFEDYFGKIPARYRYKKDHRSFWRFITSAMVDIILVYQIPVIFLSTNDQFYELLNILIYRDISSWHAWTLKYNWYSRRAIYKLPVKDNRLILLCSLPLIGQTLAKRLLDNFGTLVNICNASVKDLRQVKGLGKKKAQSIYDIFHDGE